jgi:superfamily II DNA or RNA helicase
VQRPSAVTLPPWSRSLRSWQREGVAKWAAERPQSSLAVVTPGGGKSLYSAAIAYGALSGGLVDGVIVVVPSDHLRSQLALTYAGVGIQLDPYFSNADGMYARDLVGAVVTIHQVALDPHLFRRIASRRRLLVVVDEAHHAGDNLRWGQAIDVAFAEATHIVFLSGTPFRSDSRGISLLTYDALGRVEADIVYGYRQALRDGVARPLVFHRQGGEVTWTGSDGSANTASFAGALPKQRSSERLRAALYDAGWVTEVLVRGHRILEGLRRQDRDAGGLIVCIDEAHARWVASTMAEALGFHPTVVVSADAAAGAKIKRFTDGNEPWLCAVRMVSEGVDIPRLRTLAYLTNARTELFFRQLVGRVVRARNGSTAASYVMLPDDPDLREFAQAIEDDVHGYREELPVGSARPRLAHEIASSQFESHAALHHDAGTIVGETSAAALGDPVVEAAAPPAAAAQAHGAAAPRAETALLADQKGTLRREVWSMVQTVSGRFRREPRDVYAYWAKRDGASVSQATERQLSARLRSMQTWLDENFCPVQR